VRLRRPSLRRYLESLVGHVTPSEGKKIVEEESKRLEEVEMWSKLRSNGLFERVVRSQEGARRLIQMLHSAKTLEDFLDECRQIETEDEAVPGLRVKSILFYLPGRSAKAFRDLNRIREILGLEPYAKPNSQASGASL